MNARLATASILLAVCSCGPEQAWDARDSGLVFGKRDVRQARNHLVNAAGYQPLSSKARQLDAILMMQSMPTGIVYSMQPEEGIMDPANPSCEPRTCMQDEDCESGEVCFDGACLLNPKVGSGFLTSSTRLATAHHVVWPNKEPEYVVRFGGNGDPYPDTGGGTFIGDAPPESWDQSLFPVFTNEVENFLVANRLMQIGLDEWVDPANPVAPEVREKLRAWRFVIDGDGVDVPLDFQHQRFVSLAALPARIEGQDVAFLRAHELFAPLNEGELPRSGGFPFSNPGMFFDALRASSISAASSSELDDTTPLVALHSPSTPPVGRNAMLR